MIDSNYNAATTTNTAKKDRFQIYNVLDKAVCTKAYIQQWQSRLNSMFKWEGLPDTIPERTLEDLLQNQAGFAIWAKHNDDLYINFGGLGGNDDNMNFEVAEGIITNAPANWEETVYFKNNLRHDQNAVLMRNCSNMLTMEELVLSRYSKFMVENDITLELALIQCRAMILAIAEDGDQKAAYREYMNSLIQGQPEMLIDENASFNAITINPYGSMHQALTNINECYQYLKASMMQDLGISAQNNQKREAVMSAEADLVTSGLTTLVDDMLRCRREACDQINALWGLNVTVDFDGVWKRAILSDGINADTLDENTEENGGDENAEDMAENSEEKIEENGDDPTAGTGGGSEGNTEDSESGGSEEDTGDAGSEEKEIEEEQESGEQKIEINIEEFNGELVIDDVPDVSEIAEEVTENDDEKTEDE